ncbi:MAG: hypothetical protein QOE82_1326 [Thermoanaerobaculia bacterium]|nr:hypothetical protein [Thermoanaerobaculia bacterium]
MKRALIAAAVLVDAGVLLHLAGSVVAAAVFIIFLASFFLPACALVMRLPPLRPMAPELRLTAAAVLVVILAVPWFFGRKALPFPPAIADVVLCLLLMIAAVTFGAIATAVRDLGPGWKRSRVVAVVLPVIFSLVWLGYAAMAGRDVLFHGLFAIDFGNLVSIVATLRASPSLPLAAISGAGALNYHWLYFTLPAALMDFCGASIPAFNALILMNLLMAALLVHTVATLVATHAPRRNRTAQLAVAVVLFAPFTVYYYQTIASRVSLGWFAIPVRNHLILSPLNSMIVFGNNTFALVLALFATMQLARWNRERRIVDIILGTLAVSMVIGYSVTLLFPLAAALMLWLLIGRIERPLLAFTCAVLIGALAMAVFVAIHVLGGDGPRHLAVAFDRGQFLRMVILGMLPLWGLATIGARKALTFFHLLIAASIAVPSLLYVAGSPTGQVDMSMKTGSLIAIAFAPFVAVVIEKWLDGALNRGQLVAATLLIALGLVQTAAYVLQFPYYRITGARSRSVAFPLDYYRALTWLRDHTPAESIVVDPGGLALHDEFPLLWIAERRGWLPTPYTEPYLGAAVGAAVSGRATTWAEFVRDPANGAAAGSIAREADYLIMPREVQSPFWTPLNREGSWWIYRSVRARPAKTAAG